MEFNEKLQELRRSRGLTQEQLAEELYVSRTAISKWESGRGYPNIDSLKALAKFFCVTVDELISADEVLTIADEDKKGREKRFRDILYGVLDISAVMFVFLPFFAERGEGMAHGVSLIALGGVQTYLKVIYFFCIAASALIGGLMLALQRCGFVFWIKSKTVVSLLVTTVSVLVFTVSLQPYAAVFAFILLAVKSILAIKHR